MQVLKINGLQIIGRIRRVGKRALDVRQIHSSISRLPTKNNHLYQFVGTTQHPRGIPLRVQNIFLNAKLGLRIL